MKRLAALVLLSACSVTAPAVMPRVGVSITPDAQGLGVPEAGKRIDFGRSPKGVIPVLDRELGQGRPLGLDGCPAGVVRQVAWGDLVLSFTPERFVGWRQADARTGQICAATS